MTKTVEYIPLFEDSATSPELIEEDLAVFVSGAAAAENGSAANDITFESGMITGPNGEKVSVEPIAVINGINDIRKIDLSNNWDFLPNTVTYKISELMFDQHLTLECNASKLELQHIKNFLKDKGAKDYNHLIEVSFHQLVRGTQADEDKRKKTFQVFRELLEWPEGNEGLLEDLISKCRRSVPNDPYFRLPSGAALQNIGSIIRAAESRELVVTGIGCVEEGGVGIAWGTERSFSDVEVLNNGQIIFSMRRRGDDPGFHYMGQKDHEKIEAMVEKIKSFDGG